MRSRASVAACFSLTSLRLQRSDFWVADYCHSGWITGTDYLSASSSQLFRFGRAKYLIAKDQGFDIIKEMTTTLTGKNQVTVPADIARKFGLEPGARFDWSAGERPNTIVIRIQPSKRQLVERIKELGRGIKNRDLVQELIREREKEML
jgi:bifunctional DNA-binding transcriptional regulator/antitoxin component of YhaV-PrlF toxin-antitoxin module